MTMFYDTPGAGVFENPIGAATVRERLPPTAILTLPYGRGSDWGYQVYVPTAPACSVADATLPR
jgi:hypothetical protein